LSSTASKFWTQRKSRLIYIKVIERTSTNNLG